MDFNEKVNLLRKHSKFMVSPLTEIRALAYASRQVENPSDNQIILAQNEKGALTLTHDDVAKILREYPDLKPVLK